MKNVLAISCLMMLAAGATGAMAADATAPLGLKNGSIGYAITSARWAQYQTPEAKECPDGLYKHGPREQFKAKYPNGGSVRDTSLTWESAVQFPMDYNDTFPFARAGGKIANGMNLDGKVGPNDFTSPEGEAGIDNQMFRVLGCVPIYRGPDGLLWFLDTKFIKTQAYSRLLVELTGVDNLTNDPEVDVHLYRGIDPLMGDATGENTMAGGTEHIDERFGKKYERHFKGRIENGVLITEPTDILMPWGQQPRNLLIHAARMRMNLTGDGAKGMLGGYTDVDSWYRQMTEWATHFLSYGQAAAPSLYQQMRKVADGYPDASGQMTAVSSGIQVQFAQVFIEHRPKTIALNK